VHIHKAVYSELKELWENINHKYYLFYDADLANEIPQVLHNILRQAGIFGDVSLYSHRDEVVTDEEHMVLQEDTGVTYSIKKPIAYNEFLKRISSQTSIPIVEIHKAICELAHEKDNGIPEEYINEYSATNIVNAFANWRIENTQTRFKYSRSNQSVAETALTYNDGTPKEVIKQGNIGTKFVEGTTSDKYLYDKIAFDSPLEKDNIMMSDIDEIIVYGKIPKSSVAIPTIVGENYSPDFMYVVKRTDGTKELNIIVETKLVENKSTLRGTEDVKIKCAEAFFKQLTIDGYKVSFHTQLNNKKIKQIIEDVIV
jgi:type III restriction enzyme